MMVKTLTILSSTLLVAGLSGTVQAGHDRVHVIGHGHKSTHVVHVGHAHKHRHGHRHGYRHGFHHTHRHHPHKRHHRPAIIIHQPIGPRYYYHGYPGPSAHLHYVHPRAGLSLHFGY